MEMKEIESAVEGILFASGEPVQTDRICRGPGDGPPHGGAGAPEADGRGQD